MVSVRAFQRSASSASQSRPSSNIGQDSQQHQHEGTTRTSDGDNQDDIINYTDNNGPYSGDLPTSTTTTTTTISVDMPNDTGLPDAIVNNDHFNHDWSASRNATRCFRSSPDNRRLLFNFENDNISEQGEFNFPYGDNLESMANDEEDSDLLLRRLLTCKRALSGDYPLTSKLLATSPINNNQIHSNSSNCSSSCSNSLNIFRRSPANQPVWPNNEPTQLAHTPTTTTNVNLPSLTEGQTMKHLTPFHSNNVNNNQANSLNLSSSGIASPFSHATTDLSASSSSSLNLRCSVSSASSSAASSYVNNNLNCPQIQTPTSFTSASYLSSSPACPQTSSQSPFNNHTSNHNYNQNLSISLLNSIISKRAHSNKRRFEQTDEMSKISLCCSLSSLDNLNVDQCCSRQSPFLDCHDYMRRRSSTVSQCSSILSEITRAQLNFDMSPDLDPDSSLYDANNPTTTTKDENNNILLPNGRFLLKRPPTPEPISFDTSSDDSLGLDVNCLDDDDDEHEHEELDQFVRRRTSDDVDISNQSIRVDLDESACSGNGADFGDIHIDIDIDPAADENEARKSQASSKDQEEPHHYLFI